MHTLTTRAQAERYHRQRLIQVPTPPAPSLPLAQQPLYQRTERLKGVLAFVLSIVALLILAYALYPPKAQKPTRPLRYAEEAPVSRAGWYSRNTPH